MVFVSTMEHGNAYMTFFKKFRGYVTKVSTITCSVVLVVKVTHSLESF